jgi:hypothetical protein
VLSEDQSTIKQWTVVVKTAMGIGSYYKKKPFVMKEELLKYYFLQKKEEVVLSTGGITL